MGQGRRGVRSYAASFTPHLTHPSPHKRDFDRKRHLAHLGSPFTHALPTGSQHGFYRSRDNVGASCKVDELDWQRMDRRSPINFVTARRGVQGQAEPAWCSRGARHRR